MSKKLNSPESGKLSSASDAGFDSFILETYRLIFLVIRSKAFSDHGVTIDHWAVLHALKGGASLPVSMVARRTGLSGGRVRQILLDLQRKQLVTITENEGGAKKRAVAVTGEGVDLAEAVASELRTLADSAPARKRGIEGADKEDAVSAAQVMQKRYARASSLSRHVRRAFLADAARAAEESTGETRA